MSSLIATLPGTPFGWFRLASFDELGREKVIPVSALGKDFVLWRSELGDDVVAMDAHCPHLGAHLGYGGRVIGGEIECPFHGLTFNGQGSCTGSGGAVSRIMRGRIRTYPTMIWQNEIVVWVYPDDRRTPEFDMPDEQWSRDEVPERLQFRRSWQVRGSWQDVIENAVDVLHFPVVHNASVENFHVSTDGPSLFVRSKQQVRSPFGLTDVTVEHRSIGPGVEDITLCTEVDQKTYCLRLAVFITPIDDYLLQLYLSVIGFSSSENDRIARLMERVMWREVVHQFEQDIAIWTHRKFIAKPPLLEGEQHIRTFRRWASQFTPGDLAER